MSFTPRLHFGPLLKQLRKQAGMTQRDLAAALGYSDSLISNLEKEQRQPDLQAVMQWFIPALGLQDDPQTAAQLIEQAALARGERPPAAVALQRTTRVVIQEEVAYPPARLPAPPTTLLGRTGEVQQLGNRLLGHSGRLLTLLGPPGIGKTRLALALAAHLHDHYRDGALFVSLAAISTATLMATTLLDALANATASAKPPAQQLIEHLRRKRMLLVLDNCEQILDAAPLVAAVLAECAGVVILATSRERLHLRAEQRYRVPPLPLAAAVDLFTQRAIAVNADFMLTAANRPLVAAICQRLDRLPLAIELCAAQTDLLAPSQLLAGLQASTLELLVEGAHDLPPHHRTLRTAIGRSYALLKPEERTLFRSLSVFVGGFDLGAGARVASRELGSSDCGGSAGTPSGANDWGVRDDALPSALVSTLRSLVGKSLIQVETSPSGAQRFLLLETLREFALEQVRAHEEEVALRQCHYAAYLHLFRIGDSHLRVADVTTWLARLELEQDNLRAALQWTLNTARYRDAAWLLKAASHFWYLNGHHYESASWYARLLPHRQALAVDLRLALLIGLLVSARDQEEFPDLAQYRAEIIELMELCPSKQLQAVAWHFLAESPADRARAYALARAASEAPELGPEFGGLADHEFVLAATQLGYAGSLLHQGEVEQAALLAADSLHRFRQRGNQAFLADSLGMLGKLALLRGDIAEARTRLQEVVMIGSTHNLPMVQAEWQWLLALVTLYGGNTTEAQRLLEESLRLCLATKNTLNLALVCMALAETSLWAGELAQAAAWLGQSLAYQAVPQRITLIELQTLWIAGRLATAQGQYVRAATVFGRAEAAHHQIHQIYAGPMVPLVETALATVREALDPAVFAEAFTAGQQLSLDEAYATMRASSQVVGTQTKG